MYSRFEPRLGSSYQGATDAIPVLLVVGTKAFPHSAHAARREYGRRGEPCRCRKQQESRGVIAMPVPSTNRSQPRRVVGLGEALWDFLPVGKQMGGAPLNFAYISLLLGGRAALASRIGADRLGEELERGLSRRGIDVAYLQRDPSLPTGTAKVMLSADGQPNYEIERPVAWDAMEPTSDWKELAQQADAVCFGTLAQRSEQSRKAIAAFLAATRPECVRIFDVNLRPPFYSRDAIFESIRLATIVKFNEEELAEVSAMSGLPVFPSPSDGRALASRLGVELICVTRGNRGSLLATPQQAVEHPGFPVQVVDTVGAGDAFAAAVACCWGFDMGLEKISEVANRWAGWVASQHGAMPPIDEALRCQMLP
jgi:fructokinase